MVAARLAELAVPDAHLDVPLTWSGPVRFREAHSIWAWYSGCSADAGIADIIGAPISRTIPSICVGRHEERENGKWVLARDANLLG